MAFPTILVTHKQSAFARHAQLLGCSVSDLSETASSKEPCDALFWEMACMRDVVMRNKTIGALLKATKGCTRILDFNLDNIQPADQDIISESLACCDLLRIEKQDMLAVGKLLEVGAPYIFDSCFDLMARFDIKTLILNHSNHGCHVFQGNVVSEKRGQLTFGKHLVKEAEGAFTAAYYVASCKKDALFTEYHCKALNYLKGFLDAQ